MYLTGVNQVNFQKLAFIFALGYPKSAYIFIIGICRLVIIKTRGGFDRLLVGKQHPAGKFACLAALHGPIPWIISEICI